ncbi:MAG: NAD-dependent epimerase/dehydratase family protein [Candidatus Eisenbacteria bacterium]
MGQDHIIITGAAGFIGAACVREFLAAGWKVTAIGHGGWGAKRSREARGRVEDSRLGPAGPHELPTHLPDRLRDLMGHPGLDVVLASITDREDLIATLSRAVTNAGGNCTALLHCAGRATDVGWDRSFREVNLRGVEHVCSAVLELGIGRLIHVSTTDVYGVRDFAGADEETAQENNRRNPYPKYKILAEEHIRRVLPGKRFTILRPALVWGPGDATVLPRAVAFLRASPVIVHFGRWKGRNRWPLAYVANVARVARAVATSPAAAGEAYNIVDPEPTTMDEYYRLLLGLCLPEQCGKRSVTLPLALAWPAAALSTALSTLLGRRHPLFDPSLYSLWHVAHSQEFCGEKAARLLESVGLELVGRDEALAEMRMSRT